MHLAVLIGARAVGPIKLVVLCPDWFFPCEHRGRRLRRCLKGFGFLQCLNAAPPRPHPRR